MNTVTAYCIVAALTGPVQSRDSKVPLPEVVVEDLYRFPPREVCFAMMATGRQHREYLEALMRAGPACSHLHEDRWALTNLYVHCWLALDNAHYYRATNPAESVRWLTRLRCYVGPANYQYGVMPPPYPIP